MIRDWLEQIKEIPISAVLLAGIFAVAVVASVKTDGFDFELESQLDGAHETIRTCQEDLSRTQSKLKETDAWWRDADSKYLDSRYRIQSLEDHVANLQAQQVIQVPPVIPKVIPVPKPKKAAQRQSRPKKQRQKDWWDELVEAIS